MRKSGNTPRAHPTETVNGTIVTESTGVVAIEIDTTKTGVETASGNETGIGLQETRTMSGQRGTGLDPMNALKSMVGVMIEIAMTAEIVMIAEIGGIGSEAETGNVGVNMILAGNIATDQKNHVLLQDLSKAGKEVQRLPMAYKSPPRPLVVQRLQPHRHQRLHHLRQSYRHQQPQARYL